MKKNNGFSLVEVLVVLAVMSVLMGGMGIGISVLINQRVKTAAVDTKEILQSTQQVAMSKDNCRLQITKETDGGVLVQAFSSDTKRFDSAEINDKISVSAKVGSKTVEIDDKTKLELTWERTSGAFNKCKINDVESDYCTELIFTKGTKTVTLCLATQSGRISYK